MWSRIRGSVIPRADFRDFVEIELSRLVGSRDVFLVDWLLRRLAGIPGRSSNVLDGERVGKYRWKRRDGEVVKQFMGRREIEREEKSRGRGRDGKKVHGKSERSRKM